MLSIITQAKRIIHLAWPIVITQVALSGMITVDTIMAGQYGALDLAAIGTSLGLWHPVSLFALGVITGLGAILSRDFGAGNKKAANEDFSNGIAIALLLSVFTFVVLHFRSPVIALLGLDTDMVSIMNDYLFYLMLGLPGFCLYCLFRVLNESFGNTRMLMWLQIAALLLNIPLNAVFIFGFAPIPELGGAGAGITTTILHYLLFVVLAWMSLKKTNCRQYINALSLTLCSKQKIREFLNLGIPVGCTFFFELALFGSVALAIGTYGPQAAAAHQVAINFAANMYMIPLSLSIATSVVIGQLMGAKDVNGAKSAAKAGLFMGIMVAAFTASITIWGRETVVNIYTQDTAVAALAIALLIWAAFFQLSDALQSVALGILRGFKDTRTPMLITIIAYWLIGFPVGWVLAETTWLLKDPMGINGYWAGLLISLTSSAGMLLIRLKQLNRQLAPLGE